MRLARGLEREPAAIHVPAANAYRSDSAVVCVHRVATHAPASFTCVQFVPVHPPATTRSPSGRGTPANAARGDHGGRRGPGSGGRVPQVAVGQELAARRLREARGAVGQTAPADRHDPPVRSPPRRISPVRHGHRARRRPVRVHQDGRVQPRQIDVEDDPATLDMHRSPPPRAIRRPGERGAQAQARDTVLAEHLEVGPGLAQLPHRAARVELEFPREPGRRLAQVDVLVDVRRRQLVEEVPSRDRAAVDDDAAMHLRGYGVHGELLGAHRESIHAVHLHDVGGARHRRNARRQRLTGRVLAEHELRVQRLEAGNERPVGRAIEGQVGNHPEPLLRGVEVRLDLCKQRIGLLGSGRLRDQREGGDREGRQRAPPRSGHGMGRSRDRGANA